MKFDWVLFLCISVIGPYFGGMICAFLEKSMTGGVRRNGKSRKKRSVAALISIALSFIATEQIVGLISQIYFQEFYVLMRVVTITTGVAIYLFLQSVIYAMLIIRS
jgi:hypothetical protein